MVKLLLLFFIFEARLHSVGGLELMAFCLCYSRAGITGLDHLASMVTYFLALRLKTQREQ